MGYTCDDFRVLKQESGRQCGVGIFGNDIFAVRISVADGHNSYHTEYYKITREEAEEYPENIEQLVEKYYHGPIRFLCSDYLGKNHKTYGFEK